VRSLTGFLIDFVFSVLIGLSSIFNFYFSVLLEIIERKEGQKVKKEEKEGFLTRFLCSYLNVFMVLFP